MRNTSEGQRGTWATFAKAARTGALMSQSELARRLRVDRTTVFRWESGRTRPEDADLVRAFAEVLEVDLDEALAAAGLRPGVQPPTEPTRERDEEMERILSAPIDNRRKMRMIQRLHELREQDRQRRIAEIEFWLNQDTA